MNKFLLLIFCSTGFICCRTPEMYSVKVAHSAEFIDCNVLAAPYVKEAKQNTVYTWFMGNDIHKSTGGYYGKLLDGPYTSFFISNNLKEKGSFKNGSREGKWISWYENGNIHEISYWKRGMLSGLFYSYSDNGELLLKANYKENLLNGTYMTYEKGNVVTKKKFCNNIEIVKKPFEMRPFLEIHPHKKSEIVKAETKKEIEPSNKIAIPKSKNKSKLGSSISHSFSKIKSFLGIKSGKLKSKVKPDVKPSQNSGNTKTSK